MARVRMRIVMDIDWTVLDEVIDLAKQFGKGMVVIRHADRDNYNITHASCRDRWDIPNVVVVHEVK